MEAIEAIPILASLAQDTRLSIFRLLVKAGPEGLSAGEISERLKLPGATLSFHLNDLRHATLVRQDKQGRSRIYSVRFEQVDALMRFLMEDCCGRKLPAGSLLQSCCSTEEATDRCRAQK